MIKWVDETPAKANKDYTHFNQRGAKAIGNLLYGQLNKGYEEYKVLRQKEMLEGTKPKPVKRAKSDSVSITKDSL